MKLGLSVPQMKLGLSVPQMKLGLFGTGIQKSLAPFLHLQAGLQRGFELSYELFDLPPDSSRELLGLLQQRQAEGFVGVNVTHPFKEVAAGLIQVSNPHIKSIGSVNTVRFADWQGINTDYSGFIRAYRAQFATPPGSVLLLGAGGAGKAVAFALAALGASQIRLTDTNLSRAEDLAARLPINCEVYSPTDLKQAAQADGIVNCTPIGMYQYPGLPLETSLIGGQRWAFDAIYTPLETAFLREVKAKGLEILSGAELFFYQGVDAFEWWSGQKLDEAALHKIIWEKLKSREAP
jgi:shikimate dehydrogenase